MRTYVFVDDSNGEHETVLENVAHVAFKPVPGDSRSGMLRGVQLSSVTVCHCQVPQPVVTYCSVSQLSLVQSWYGPAGLAPRLYHVNVAGYKQAPKEVWDSWGLVS
jgi:hypothetical protein